MRTGFRFRHHNSLDAEDHLEETLEDPYNPMSDFTRTAPEHLGKDKGPPVNNPRHTVDGKEPFHVVFGLREVLDVVTLRRADEPDGV